jgi:hypothetical protein
LDKLISFLPIKSKVKIDESFAEWFSGFADAEGTFIIRILEGRAVSLTFRIKLHKDDFEILYKIKNKLGIVVWFYIVKPYPSYGVVWCPSGTIPPLRGGVVYEVNHTVEVSDFMKIK